MKHIIISIFPVFDPDVDSMNIQGYDVLITKDPYIVGIEMRFYKRLGNAMNYVKSFPDGTQVFLPNGNLISLPI